jgi:hypothetical protein
MNTNSTMCRVNNKYVLPYYKKKKAIVNQSSQDDSFDSLIVCNISEISKHRRFYVGKTVANKILYSREWEGLDVKKILL